MSARATRAPRWRLIVLIEFLAVAALYGLLTIFLGVLRGTAVFGIVLVPIVLVGVGLTVVGGWRRSRPSEPERNG
jgi:hypothetical protein